MTIRLRAWLASFALSCIPAFAWGQQYIHPSPTAPVALEARLSLSDRSWDPAALVAALTPRGVDATIGVEAVEAEPEPAAEPPSLKKEPPAEASESCPREPACVAAPKTDAPAAVPCHSGLTPEPAPQFHELIGVDHCVPESLRRRIAIARKLTELAAEEPVDAAVPEAAEKRVAADASQPSAATQGSDSPVIVTLVEQEEYLSYDLTPIDRVKRQLFPFGLPRYVPDVRLPLQPADRSQPLFEIASAPADAEALANAEPSADADAPAKADALAEADAPAEADALALADPGPAKRASANDTDAVAPSGEATEETASVVVAEPALTEPASTEAAPMELTQAGAPQVAPQPHPLPIDCLVDEAIWQLSQLEAKHHVSQRFAPKQIGRNLARLIGASDSARDSAPDPLEEALAALETQPAEEVDQAGTPRIAAVPSVAASLDSELAGAPSVCCPFPEATDEATDAVPDEATDAVPESTPAAVATLDLEAVESALADDEDSALGTLIDDLAEAKAAAPAAGEEAGEQSASTLTAATESAPGDVVAADAVAAEDDPARDDPALDRAVAEWNKVLGFVRAFSDQWNERVASQPEENAVR